MNAAKLKENAFWVGCGAALVLLAAVYLFMYRPRAEELNKTLGTGIGRSRRCWIRVRSRGRRISTP